MSTTNDAVSTKTLKGTWMFNNTLTEVDFEFEEGKYLNFVSNAAGTERNYVRIQGSTDLGSSTALVYVYHDLTSGYYPEETVYFYPNSMDLPVGWQNEAAQIIDFGEIEQEVPDDFYAWFIKNATAVVVIDITKNGNTVLATAGKYCDRNIVIRTKAT